MESGRLGGPGSPGNRCDRCASTEYRRQILRSQGLDGFPLPDHAPINLPVTRAVVRRTFGVEFFVKVWHWRYTR